MQYKTFKDGIQLSRLGMGNMRLPVDGEGRIDYPKAKAIVDAAIKAGINHFDTAYIYHGGESEAFTGRALRESVVRFFNEHKCQLGADRPTDFYLCQ